jgi:hypothetical protein
MKEKESGGESFVAPTTRSISPQEVPTTPFVLSLVAGVFILLGAFMPLVFMGNFGRMGGMMEGSDMSGMMGTDSILMRIVGLAVGGVVLYGAIMLNARPARHVTWGSLILVFSILSVFGAMGGFGIGLILGVIAGALAIAWRPAAAVPYSAPAGRYCPHCGRAIAMDARFCSYCGQQLPA